MITTVLEYSLLNVKDLIAEFRRETKIIEGLAVFIPPEGEHSLLYLQQHYDRARVKFEIDPDLKWGEVRIELQKVENAAKKNEL